MTSMTIKIPDIDNEILKIVASENGISKIQLIQNVVTEFAEAQDDRKKMLAQEILERN